MMIPSNLKLRVLPRIGGSKTEKNPKRKSGPGTSRKPSPMAFGSSAKIHLINSPTWSFPSPLESAEASNSATRSLSQSWDATSTNGGKRCPDEEKMPSYPLVNCYITMERSTILMDKSTISTGHVLPFYQRVRWNAQNHPAQGTVRP